MQEVNFLFVRMQCATRGVLLVAGLPRWERDGGMIVRGAERMPVHRKREQMCEPSIVDSVAVGEWMLTSGSEHTVQVFGNAGTLLCTASTHSDMVNKIKRFSLARQSSHRRTLHRGQLKTTF